MPHLEFPNLSHKESYLAMIREWEDTGEEIIPGRLSQGGSFEKLIEDLNRETTDNLHGVNSHLFFLMEQGNIIGALQIRHHIDHPNLIETGGHMGYGIRPSERGKGYATEMLRLGLIEAQKIGIKKVLFVCNDENLGSRKVIEHNGGVFERYVEQDGRKMRRYWITL